MEWDSNILRGEHYEHCRLSEQLWLQLGRRSEVKTLMALQKASL